MLLVGAGAVVVCIALWRVMFGIASTFVGLSEGMAKYGFLALATAMVTFAGIYTRARLTINPDKVYRIAMTKLNTSAAILEVMGAPLTGTDVRAYVMSGGGPKLKDFKFRLGGKRCFLIFPIKGSERKGLVSVEVKKKKGQYDMKLLAVDIPMASGPDQRLFLVGDEKEYKVGGGLISELRDPIVKAMAAEKEFDYLDEREDAEDERREREEAERRQQEEEAEALRREEESWDAKLLAGSSRLKQQLPPNSCHSSFAALGLVWRQIYQSCPSLPKRSLLLYCSQLLWGAVWESVSHVDLLGQERSDEEQKIDFKGGNVHVITNKENWDQKIAEANKDGKMVIANFSASWCGPCRVIAPVYAEMSQTYPQFMFLTIDVDELMDFSSSWDIRATPTFFFLKNGEQVDKLVGANRPELEKKIVALADGA
uniref:Thioredoxin domain-containing protein n=1 Tax=Oryza brachyantha TaxID=4533 RepID=J3KWQ9_ORYBR